MREAGISQGVGGSSKAGAGGASASVMGEGGSACVAQPELKNDPRCPTDGSLRNGESCATLGLTCGFLKPLVSPPCIQAPLVGQLLCCGSGWFETGIHGTCPTPAPNQDPRCPPAPPSGACSDPDGARLDCLYLFSGMSEPTHHQSVCANGNWQETLENSRCPLGVIENGAPCSNAGLTCDGVNPSPGAAWLRYLCCSGHFWLDRDYAGACPSPDAG